MKTSPLMKTFGRGLLAAFSAVPAEKPVSPGRSPAAAWTDDPESCTSIMAGRLATVDGSVITCHTCDGNYRQWVNIVPGRERPEKSANKIYSGKMHTETVADLCGIVQT